MVISIDSRGDQFRRRVLLLRTLRNVVCRQIELWDCINRLEALVDMETDAQLWIDRMTTLVATGRDLTLAHVDDYLSTFRIHVISKNWNFANRESLLPKLTNAVNLNINFRHSLEQLKTLVDVNFDPVVWVRATSTVVEGGMDLTMADVDDYMTGSA
jgi:hypothetical protein